jgi:hypothetical protein
MKTKKLFLAVRTSSSYELQPNWRPVSASPAKRDLFISVSLECDRFTGTALIGLTMPQSFVRVIRGRQLDPARHGAQLCQNGPLPRYSCRKRKPTNKLTKLLG